MTLSTPIARASAAHLASSAGAMYLPSASFSPTLSPRSTHPPCVLCFSAIGLPSTSLERGTPTFWWISCSDVPGYAVALEFVTMLCLSALPSQRTHLAVDVSLGALVVVLDIVEVDVGAHCLVDGGVGAVGG